MPKEKLIFWALTVTYMNSGPKCLPNLCFDEINAHY